MRYQGLNLFIEKMNSLEDNKFIIDDINGNSMEVYFKLNTPVKMNEIEDLKEELEFNTPKSFETFLLHFNGGELYNYTKLDGIKILSMQEIIEINKMLAKEYEEDWIENIIVFAECIGEGNYLGFKIEDCVEEYKILDCFHEELPVNWEVIANSFDELLESLVLHNGSKYWL